MKILAARLYQKEKDEEAKGRIAFADWLRGFGFLIILDHGDGSMTLYGHNESLFKDTGEWVAPGEIIGTVGVTGGRSKPGTYFGIRHKGRPENPKRWCRRIMGDRVSRVVSPIEGIPAKSPLRTSSATG